MPESLKITKIYQSRDSEDSRGPKGFQVLEDGEVSKIVKISQMQIITTRFHDFTDPIVSGDWRQSEDSKDSKGRSNSNGFKSSNNSTARDPKESESS